MKTKTTPIIRRITTALATLLVVTVAPQPAFAADVIKADNADNLNLTTSWVGAVLPTAADTAVWNSTVTAANTTLLGANASWLGLKITNPGGAVLINAGSTLTLGGGGIDMSAATQNLSLSNAVTIGPNYQKWTVANGQALNVLALPSKPGTGSATEGAVEFSTTGTITLGSTTAGRITDSQGNPWATYGKNDWAGLNAGQVVAATYTDVTTALTGGADNNIVGDLPGGAGSAVDVASIRFNDSTPRSLNIANSGTSRTCTARGVLVTENCGGATIGGSIASSFIRPARSSTAAATAFHFIQNSVIGNLTVSAKISNGSSGAPVKLVKSGPGKMILADNVLGNGYSGGTVVHGGILQVNVGASLVTGAVLVNSGQLAVNTGSTQNVASITISGTGTNSVTVGAANGVFQSTTLTFNSGAPRLEFSWNSGIAASTTAAPYYVTNLTLNGAVTLDIFNGGLTVGTFPLIKRDTQTGSGSFALGFLPPRVTAHLATNVVNNTIDLVVDSVTAPISWATGSGNWDIATSSNWKDAVAATTTYQELLTPYGSFGDSVQFEDTLSGTSPLTVTLNTSVKPASVVVAGTTAYTNTGRGALGGAATLNKSGAGTLTLQTANTFTGAANLNGGTVVLSSLASLGAGTAINFGGGTLEYPFGVIDDISVRTVTFNAGGATINDGGNSITFAAPVGNNGVGGLTKTGTGTLYLNGTNRYSGNTLVNQGTLVLGANTYISNSPLITVASAGTLDVNTPGLRLNSGINQILAGNGTVNGAVTVDAGTSITPGTSVGTLTNTDLTLAGGTYVYEVSTTSRDLVVVNGNVTLNSGTIQVVASGILTNGSYPLIEYSGTLLSGPGSSANLIVSGFAQAGKVASLSDATPGRIDLVIQTAGGASIVWQGDGGGNLWDVETSANWTNASGSPVMFVNGDLVTFNDSSLNVSPSLASSVAPGSVTVNAAQDYTFQTASNGRISGSASLTKSGSGRLTILTANNNSGPTVVNSGVLQVGNNATTGDLGTGHVTNNAALVFQQTDARTVSGVLVGSGSIEQAGSSTLTLAGATTYTGPTTVSSGTLQVGTGGVSGTLATSTITNNGTVVLNSSSSWTYANGLRGSGSLVKSGSGTLTLSGVTTYEGNTSISNGVLRITANETIPDGGTSTGWLILDGSASAAGTFDLNGFNETVNALSGLGSTVNGLITNSGTTGTNLLTIGNNNASDTAIFARIAENTAGAKLAVIKKGNSLQTLSGANSYVAGTVVQEGTLRLQNNAAAGSGSIVLSNGTTLSLNTAPGNNSIFPANDLITPADATVTTTANNVANGYAMLFYGSATSTNSVPAAISVSTASTKQFQNFNGTVRVETTGSVRFSSTSLSVNGGDNTIFEVLGTLNTRNGTGGGAGIALGALTGTGTLGGAGNADGNSVYVIGAKGIDTTFSGTISGTPPRGTSITKVGAGTLTLDGTLSYVGTTTVSNGVLVLGGAAELDDSPTINVRTGATLDVSAIGGVLNLGNLVSQSLNGAGTIRGSVVQNANSQIAPGDGVGILTVTNTVTLGGTNVMEINRTNALTSDRIVAQQGFIVSGTPYVVVQNVGATNFTVGDKFFLFNQPVSGLTISGNLPTLPCAGLSWSDKLAVDGSLEVVGSPCVNTTPTNITSTVVGNTLDLQWPSDRTGWTLQTNAVNVADPGAWFAYPGSVTTNRVILTIDPAKTNVFYRLTLPLP